MKNKHFTCLIILLILTSLILKSQNKLNDSLILKKANELKYKKPDSSAYFYNELYKLKLKKKDTAGAIRSLIQRSTIYSHNINYGRAYDGYWKALLLADKSNNLVLTSEIFQELGLLYSFYKRDKEALKYFNQSNAIRKELSKTEEGYLEYVSSNYFSIVNLYRENKNYEKVKIYLDSCYYIQNKLSTKSYYIESEAGYLFAINGDFKNALKKLKESEEFFIKNDKTYLIVIYALFGEVYKLQKKYNESIEYFNKSLSLSYLYSSHLNYRLNIYEALAEVYFTENKFDLAYFHLSKAKKLNDDIFGGKSANNQHLLEIKDKYRLEKDKQEDLIKQQKITQLEHEDKVWFLQTMILVVVFMSILLSGYLFFRQIKLKHKNEKKVLEEKQKLRLQKQNEILELKNKELTEAALRLIEKDEFITSIKKKLSENKDNININVIKRVLKSIQGSPTKNWSEFEAHFTQINLSFYNNLKKEFPKLSQTDQKICALVKLNFPSKDMARLLGISVESVHTSRYRLRKKLGLDRNDNLEEFINKF